MKTRGPDPRFVIIRRVRLAYTVRDAIYGCTARPLGRKLRSSWTRLLAFYVRSRMLTYTEVLQVAEALGADLRAQGGAPAPADGPHDLGLRLELSRRLVEAARRKAAREGPRDEETYRWERGVGLIRSAMQQLALDRGDPIDGHGGVVSEQFPALRRG